MLKVWKVTEWREIFLFFIGGVLWTLLDLSCANLEKTCMVF